MQTSDPAKPTVDSMGSAFAQQQLWHFCLQLAMPQTKVWWKGMDNQWPGKKIPGAEENRLVALNMSCAFDSLMY